MTHDLYSPSGSSVHGILQARVLAWVAIPFFRGSSQPRDQTWVSCIADSLPLEPPGKPVLSLRCFLFLFFWCYAVSLWYLCVGRMLKSSYWEFIELPGFENFVCVYMCVLVAQLCLILCHPINCSPPDFSVHGILQARILEWIAILLSRGTSQPRDWTLVSCFTGRFFTVWATGNIFSNPRKFSVVTF